MSIRINDTFEVRAPKPIDERGGVWSNADGKWTLHTSVANVLASLTYRYIGQTVPLIISGVQQEYWFVDGIADVNFVAKTKTLDSTTILNFSGGVPTITVVWDNEMKAKHGLIPIEPTVLVQATSDPDGTWTILRSTIKYVINIDTLVQMTISVSSLKAKIIFK